MHGAFAGAPLGNNNRRQHGAFAGHVMLTKGEASYFDSLNPLDLSPVLRVLHLRFLRLNAALDALDRKDRRNGGGRGLPIEAYETGPDGARTMRRRPDLILSMVRVSGRIGHLAAVQHEIAMGGTLEEQAHALREFLQATAEPFSNVPLTGEPVQAHGPLKNGHGHGEG
jgi:hypothetical protein